ncbi:Ubiquitin family protein [Mycena kentingensis (nom. inval.)]|nr:Ubiquitin family protein [Mycena kentingensis (nom. inval.)]
MPKAAATAKRIPGTVYLRFGYQTKLVPSAQIDQSYADVLRLVNRHFPETRGKSVDIKADLLVDAVVITPDVWCTFIDSVEGKNLKVDIFTIAIAPHAYPADADPPKLSAAKAKKLSLRVDRGDGRDTLTVKIGYTKPLSALERAAISHFGWEGKHIKLVFEGRRLETHLTPADYDMEDGDKILVFVEQLGGKPVIYLRSPVELDATVDIGLTPDWSFSALYPVVPATKPQDPRLHEAATWRVWIKPDGTLLDESSGAEVSYLFWEASTNLPAHSELSPPPSPILGAADVFRPVLARSAFKADSSVALTIEELPLYLDAALVELGLDTEARTSFITYWLPALNHHKCVLLSFLPQASYESAAPLTVTPHPDVVTRVFMIFRALGEQEAMLWEGKENRDASMWREVVGVPSKAKQQDMSLFRVLEWGGMEPKDAHLHQSATWSVRTKTDGTLLDRGSGVDVSYLFWEALTNPIGDELSPPPSPILGAIDGFRPALARNAFKHATSVALTIQELPLYVDATLLDLGLDTEARTSFITYWLPSFLEHNHILLSFVPQSAYEAAAPLTIVPAPNAITRVFMIFRALDDAEVASCLWEKKEARPIGMWRGVIGVPERAQQADASLFRVLEWGGMEVKVSL